MKFIKPEAEDIFDYIESVRVYRAYLETVHFPEQVEVYLREPRTWEHQDDACPHDFFLEKCLIADPLPGADVSENNPRIIVQIVLFCPKRKVTMTFSYEGVQHADLITSSGEWHGKLPQVIADEVTSEGVYIVHEWYLEYYRFIKIKCKTFKRTLETVS